jgi:5-methylcytosine-specific restriction endonuclease McrA
MSNFILLIKKCTICKETKSWAEFPYKYKSGKTQAYRQSHCKKCKNHGKLIRRRTNLQTYVNRKVKSLAAFAKKKYQIVKTDQEIKLLKESLYNLILRTPKCPYTKEPLDFKTNLHLDHKIPVSRDSSKILDLENLQWVSEIYNHAKWDQTDEEFNQKYIIRYRSPKEIQKPKRGPILFKKRSLLFARYRLTPYTHMDTQATPPKK